MTKQQNTITIPLIIPDKCIEYLIDDFVVSPLDWVLKIKRITDKVLNEGERYQNSLGEFLANGGSIEVKCGEHDELTDEDEIDGVYTLTKEKVIDGIQRHLASSSYCVDDYLWDYDLNDVDNIIQLSLFGEIIYG